MWPNCFPDGSWVFYTGSFAGWRLSRHEPKRLKTFDCCITHEPSVSAKDYAEFHGEEFTPPEGIIVQVMRP